MDAVLELFNLLASKGVKLSAEDGRLTCYAPKGVLTRELREEIARHKPQIISLLTHREVPPVPRNELKEIRVLLSAAQKRLYILQKLHPRSAVYHVHASTRASDMIDADLLSRAWASVLRQFPVLTGRVLEEKGNLYQSLREGRGAAVQQPIHFTGDPQLLFCLREQARRPFDLDRGPLTRLGLFTADTGSVVLLTAHEIVCDQFSASVVLKSLLRCYQQMGEGKPIVLTDDPLGFQDFVPWEEAMLASPDGVSHAAYWRRQLAGELPTIELIPDFPHEVESSWERRLESRRLPEDLAGRVRDLSTMHLLPVSVIVLAGFKLLLQRYTSQDDIIVGMPVRQRAAHKFGDVGCFGNMVPLRTQCDQQLLASEFMQRLRVEMAAAMDHSEYPFALMLGQLKAQDIGKNPVFQATYAYRDAAGQSGPRPGGSFPVRVEGILQETEADLGLEVREQDTSFQLTLEYNPQKYKEATVRRFLANLCTLLEEISTRPNLPLHQYSILTPQEKQQLLVAFNDTQAEYRKDQCIHNLFLEQVALHAESIALQVGEVQLSYQELFARSRDLALYLQSLGAKPETIVGVCLERSLDMIVAMLGILMAGAAYVPLDPDYPEERLAFMVRDTQAAFVLTQQSLECKLRGLVTPETPFIFLDRQRAEIDQRVSELKKQQVQLERMVTPRNLAYIIYTSGSTGRPKGVAIEHHSAVTMLYWSSNVYSKKELAGVLTSTSICFDISVFEIFAPLANGGKIILVANALGLINLPDKNTVTLINTGPSVMEELLRLTTLPPSVRTVNLAGEALSSALVDRIYDNSEVEKVYDLYGPSEDTTYSTYALRNKNGPQTIGRPIANTQVYILDPQQQLQPVGVPGEVHIAGGGLSRGYLYRPELTREKFIANPFEPGTRMYKTGDLARWLDDGNLQYLGRIDTQVKIRGIRIETGEIEAHLNRHPQVEECAVIGRGEGAGKQLIGFYRAKNSTSDRIVQLPYQDLRAHLSLTLPQYMVPGTFISLAAIPLNPNGKVDRRALARIEVTLASGQEYVAPHSQTERQLVAIWAQLLQMAPEKIGMNDSFFELGGHSLMATQFISKMRNGLGIELPLRVMFEQTTIAQLGALIANVETRNLRSIRPVDRTEFDRLPLSFAQERVWFLEQFEPGSVRYNIPQAFKVKGELDIDQLEQAFNLVIARHENLRTLFLSQDGQAQQVIDVVGGRPQFAVERVDLTQNPDQQAQAKEARELCQAEAARPFVLARGPLLRVKVIKLAAQEHIVLLSMHHIVSDGWSMGVLMKELDLIREALRQGVPPALPPLPIQYVDYSVWQRRWLEQDGRLQQQLSYWKEKLAGLPESLDLATDYARPSVQSFAGATHAFTLDPSLTAQLKSLAEQKGGTLFMVLLAAFKVLLHRYTEQNDICVGTPIANRQYEETQGLIGMFINTLALRSQVEGEDTFSALLSQVKATCLDAYEHQDAPFERVVDLLRPQRNLATSPLFQIMLVLQNVANSDLDLRYPHYAFATDISKFDLSVEFSETPEGLAGSIEYATALYKPETIARMAGHLTALCRAVTAAPTAKIRDLQYIGEAERQQLLTGYNDTLAEYPKDKCVHELFIEQAKAYPARTAVIAGEEEVSYQQLSQKSRDLALYLQAMGVKPDSVVGLCVERSLEMVVGILGTVQAGGAYLPLDPTYPDDRLAYMLQDSQVEIVLTQEKFRNRLKPLAMQDTKLIVLDKPRPGISQGVALRREVKPNHAAYLIYTSGSTGKPKGVLVEHQALMNRIYWMQQRYRLDAGDVVLQKTPYSFDVSVWEFFWPLMAGAAIVMAAPEGHKDVRYLAELITRRKVTTVHFVPPMLHTFLDNAELECGSVKQIFSSGEALDRISVDRYRTTFPFAALHNLYGPTEAAIDVTAYDCGHLPYPFVPIGAPIANTQIYILDANKQLQPIAVPGELHIAGVGLARGYLNRPQLTQERFVANPFVPGTRMYKTGDVARWLDDGNLQYFGRIDTQVKVRGVRIETSEIEAYLNQHPEVEDSAVIGRGEGADKHLVAFYRARTSTADALVQLPYQELRAHLMQALPDYMVPGAFVSLAMIPLNSNGKVDRRALQRMEVTVASGRQYVPPRTQTEEQLVEIWARLLQLAPEKIGMNDNFFELGGHSLMAVRLVERMRQQGLRASLRALFTAPTLAKLAAVVEQNLNSETAAGEVEVDFEREISLDRTIVRQTEGPPGEMRNVFLTGANGFLGAFLLAKLLQQTSANIYCLVRAESVEAGFRKIERAMKSYGLWDQAALERIVSVVGDLARPQLGLTQETFDELAEIMDAIYHSGATVNFYYPYSHHRAANVLGTQELLRMASYGRSKSLHYISTLSVVLSQERQGAQVISEHDQLSDVPNLADGYVASKWVAEKLVAEAASRGIPVVTYRPGTIMGHSKTGAANLDDFVPSFIRACMQAGCVPEADVHDELHLMPVDYLSRSIIEISQRPQSFGRTFNLTHPRGTTGRELLDHLLRFDPTLQRVSYSEWRSQVARDSGNAFARHIGAFPESLPSEERPPSPTFDSEETLSFLEASGIDRPHMNEKLFDNYFSYLSEDSCRSGVAAD